MRCFCGIVLVFCFVLFAAPPFIEGYAETDRAVRLTLDCRDQDGAVSGACFSLYRIADVLPDRTWSLTDTYAGYPLWLQDLDSAGLHALACTLSGYIARDGLSPCDFGITGDMGQLYFPSRQPEMTAGLYLVIGEPLTVEDTNLLPDPFFVWLPETDTSGAAFFDVTVFPKFEKRAVWKEAAADLSVEKIWLDDGAERPEAINIQLFCDGVVYSTVTLGAEHGWRHTWPSLAAGCSWQLVEDGVPEGYAVSVDREGQTFLVTNRAYPAGDGTGGVLPQTGRLWWPVPLLTVGGISFLLAGRNKRGGT